jgi:hypothetical protein
MATRNIVPRATGEGSIGTAAKHWGAGHFDTLPNWQEYLAESTGYGIVSGCEPTISGLTVTVGAGIVHLAGGTRKEIASTTVTLDAADSTNPRIDLVYIDSTGTVAKITGTAAANPSAPTLPTGGISVCNVTIVAGATTGTVTDSRGMLSRFYNTGIVNVTDFGAVGDGVTDDTSAFEAAISASENNTLFIPNGNYKINSTLIANKAKTVINNGNYTGVEPIYPIGDNLSKMALNLTPEIQINYPSVAEPTSTVSYYCQSVGYNPVNDHVLLVFAGYTIATGANDQPGKVVEMTADYQTVINSATVDVGHGNGCCYCEKDGKWYIATGFKGVISLNTDLSLNDTHLPASADINYAYWTIIYNKDKDAFYVQSGDTGTENSAKINIYSYNWDLLSQTVIERVKNRYGTGYLTSQDAILINDDYVELYYGDKDISIVTFDMLTGKVKEQDTFDNAPGREPEGLYVKDNQLVIVSVNGSNLLAYSTLLNNSAIIPEYQIYGTGQTFVYTGIIVGYFTSGGTELMFSLEHLPIKYQKQITLDFNVNSTFIVRQNGNYIINIEAAPLTGYNAVAQISESDLLGVTKQIVMTKTDGTAFVNVVNNDIAVIFCKLTIHVA